LSLRRARFSSDSCWAFSSFKVVCRPAQSHFVKG
jgi:hypothetical protein